jgi:hypothetical protein
MGQDAAVVQYLAGSRIPGSSWVVVPDASSTWTLLLLGIVSMFGANLLQRRAKQSSRL